MIDRIATTLIWLGVLVIMSLLAGFLGYVLAQGLGAIDWQFLSSAPLTLSAGGGIGPQLWNSFYLLVLTLLITIPLSLGGGIYLAEYAHPGYLTALIHTSTETLASLPSIVIGLFGLLIFVQATGWGYSMAAGALAISVLSLPVMLQLSENAIRSVPRDLKEAALALGATRFESIMYTVVPAAFPSLVTGVILISGRVFGEAAALLYTAGLASPPLDFADWNPLSSRSPLHLFRPAETLAVHIWKVNAEGLVPDLERVANGSAAVLILAVLFFNVAARLVAHWLYRRITSSR